MYFALSDEQRALQDTVRSFLSARFGLAEVRAVYDDLDGDADPPRLWSSIAEQGFLAVLVPERYDGMGLGLLDAVVLARAFGAGMVPGPHLPTLLGGEAVRLAGGTEQQQRLLPRLAGGELKIAVAVRRDGGAWSPAGVGVTADGDRLFGTAAHVEYAQVADLLVVAAREGGRVDASREGGRRDAAEADAGAVGLFLVDPAAPGVDVVRHDTLDRTTRLCTLSLSGVAAERLPGGSAAVLADLLDRAATLAAADLAGIARAALTATVGYDRDRVQFGRPVGSFQAVAHALADLHVGVTMAEHGGLFAAYAIDEGLADARLMVSVAKAKASDVARDATAAMIQYHGGIGYTWEHEAHWYFKRAKRQEYAYGDAAEHRDRIAALVVDTRAGTAGASG